MAVRMYITTVFNRDVDKNNDYVSVGGYEITFKDYGTMRFDFDESSGSIDGNSVSWELRNLSTDAFPESEDLQDCLINDEIVGVSECFVYIGGAIQRLEGGKSKPLHLTGLKDLGFWVQTDSADEDIIVPNEMLEEVELD